MMKSHAPVVGASCGATDRSRANAEMISAWYDAFLAGDVDAAAQYLAPDYVLHVPGDGHNAGEYWGVEGFRRFAANIASHNGGIFEMQVPTLAVSDDHAFTREVIRINRAHDTMRVHTLRLSNWFKIRNGRVSEAWVIPEDQRAYDDYWAWSPDDSPITRFGGPPPRARGVLDIEKATSVENAELVAGMYDRFWNGDGDAMRRMISDDVVVNIVGQSAMSDLYRGWNGYMAFRERLMTMAGEKYKLDVIALAASEQSVFAVEYIRMNRMWDASVREIQVLMHYEIVGGMIVRMDDFPLDTYAWESFYTSPAGMRSFSQSLLR